MLPQRLRAAPRRLNRKSGQRQQVTELVVTSRRFLSGHHFDLPARAKAARITPLEVCQSCTTSSVTETDKKSKAERLSERGRPDVSGVVAGTDRPALARSGRT
jgi:hypothetical protein